MTFPILKYFENYYNIKYPLAKSGESLNKQVLSKLHFSVCYIHKHLGAIGGKTSQTITFLSLDQIALPNFAAGAMENWGLVTYREKSLFYDPKVSTNKDKEWVIGVIAHELAHMVCGLCGMFLIVVFLDSFNYLINLTNDKKLI